MKLTNEDKVLLAEWGHEEEDYQQIETTTEDTHTTYWLLAGGEGDEDAPITQEEALALLGRSQFLNGIARSAFHGTAIRDNAQGRKVLFDSSHVFDKYLTGGKNNATKN